MSKKKYSEGPLVEFGQLLDVGWGRSNIPRFPTLDDGCGDVCQGRREALGHVLRNHAGFLASPAQHGWRKHVLGSRRVHMWIIAIPCAISAGTGSQLGMKR